MSKISSPPDTPSSRFSSRNNPSEFARITRSQSKKAENKQACDTQSISIDEKAKNEGDKMGEEVDTSCSEVVELDHDEEQQLLEDLSGAAILENHEPDRTPQQKKRRKKHRPKVVIEGQPKRTRKPVSPMPANTNENPTDKRKYVRRKKLNQTQVTPMPVDPMETPTGKRKYVRKNKLDQIPVTPKPATPNETPTGKRKYVRRNKIEQTCGTGTPPSELTSGITDPEPAARATKSCRKTLNFDVERQVREESSLCGSQCNSDAKPQAQNNCTRVESKLNLQVDQGPEVMDEKTQAGIAYDPNCSINKVVPDYTSVPKKQPLSPQTPSKLDAPHEKLNTCAAKIGRANVIGGHYNSLHEYLGLFPTKVYNDTGIPGIYFPTIFWKKRTKKGHSSMKSSTPSAVASSEHNVRQEIHRPLCNRCAVSPAQFSTSSTSTKTATVVDAQGKQQTFECKLALNQKRSMTKGRPRGPSRAHTRATMTIRKWTKRNSSDNSVTIDATPTIDQIVEQLKSLDITSKESSSLVPYNQRYRERGALVLYQGAGNVVPFEGSFDPLSKRRPRRQRTKVDIDEETDKVWKLLLENSNSEGIDGRDEEKSKWWGEERKVFQGRVDSFIARMHLVQGDRRFSPWKGSVVDSVVGVFLTQNVSDHLSSSAFMALAARFPLKPKSKNSPSFVETTVMTKEPELLGSSSGGEESIDSLKCKSSDTPANGQEMNDKSTANRAAIQLEEALPSSAGSKREMDAVLCDSSEKSGNNPKYNDHKEAEPSLKDHGYLPGKAINGTSSDSSKVKRRTEKKKENKVENQVDWDRLRQQAQDKGKRREKTTNTMDSLDWEAVQRADVNEIANTIKKRGMNNRLAKSIKDFLDRLVKDHGSIDLEWLKDVPPDKVKDYLLSFKGLGLKSTECVRLLTLQHLAFPVDTNVGRVTVRLGWVPLKPLPESLQLHLLELYPMMESIQKYLWPRLCKLDQGTLYELHYQMITFGKVFCTKSNPNCNACPLRGECRHFASAFASARVALPAPADKSIVTATENDTANQNPVEVLKPLWLPLPQPNQELKAVNTCGPNISVLATPEPIVEMPTTPKPIVEVPATPEPEQPQVLESDIEDAFWEDPEGIPTIKLNIEEFSQNLQNYMQQNMELQDGDMSKAVVALTPAAASIPIPKLKNVSRLRTEHQVYELPDSHPLLEGLHKREPDDPGSYLLAIWTPGETANSIQPPETKCSSQELGKLCDRVTCFSCNSIREENLQTVRGTLLIPCRTAMRGSFPLNGTYFQVNEVFADHDSSMNPIDVPRAWIWNLPRRTVYFGTSIPSIFKGLSTEAIQYCFWRGFVCVRGFEQKTRAPRPLMARLHFPASKLTGPKARLMTSKNNSLTLGRV